jgi:hypothetical protein
VALTHLLNSACTILRQPAKRRGRLVVAVVERLVDQA